MMIEKTSHHPKVSVIITTHNRATLLGRAIDSVINQTYENVEIVIVDDCSIDNTGFVIEKYQNKYSNIIAIKNETILGAPMSRNIGVKGASGLFITGLDDDDEFTPTRISSFVENFSSEWSFLCSGFFYQKNNKLVPIRNYEEKITLDEMLFFNRASNHGFLLRARYLSINGQDQTLVACEDYDFWLRLIEKFGPAKRLPEASYLIHEDHGFERITNSPNEIIGLKQVIKKHQKKMSAEQFKAQQLNLYIKRKEMLPFKNLLELISAKIIWKAIKYYLTSNFKLLHKIDQNLLMLYAHKSK